MIEIFNVAGYKKKNFRLKVNRGPELEYTVLCYTHRMYKSENISEKKKTFP